MAPKYLSNDKLYSEVTDTTAIRTEDQITAWTDFCKCRQLQELHHKEQ